MEQKWPSHRIRRARRRRGERRQLRDRSQRGLRVRRRCLVLQVYNKRLGVSQRRGQSRRQTRKIGYASWGRSRAGRRRANGPALRKGRHDRHQVLQHSRIKKHEQQRQKTTVCKEAEQFFVSTAERSVFAAVPDSAAGRQTALKKAKRRPTGTDRRTFLKAGSGPGTVDLPTGTGP